MPYDFVLTGWRRSGTTMFASLLKAHPQVSCDSDSFNYFFHGRRYFDFLRAEPPPHADGVEAMGIKLLDPFLVPHWKYRRMHVRALREGAVGALPPYAEYQDLMAAFTQRLLDTKPKVLNLVRHALFVYVSEQVALQRREFKYKTPFEARFRHVFDLDHFVRWFRTKREIERRVAFLKPEDRCLNVFYEDLMSPDHREETLAEVFRHIGVEPAAVQPKTVKQLPNDLRDYVLNFDEMVAALKASPYPYLADWAQAD